MPSPHFFLHISDNTLFFPTRYLAGHRITEAEAEMLNKAWGRKFATKVSALWPRSPASAADLEAALLEAREIWREMAFVGARSATVLLVEGVREWNECLRLAEDDLGEALKIQAERRRAVLGQEFRPEAEPEPEAEPL